MRSKFLLIFAWFLVFLLPSTAKARMENQASDSTPMPWRVTLYLPGETPGQDRAECQGVVIAEHWIMTAAHCVVEEFDQELKGNEFIQATYVACDWNSTAIENPECGDLGTYEYFTPKVEIAVIYGNKVSKNNRSKFKLNSFEQVKQMVGSTIFVPKFTDETGVQDSAYYIIDKVVVHPDYHNTDRRGEADIALLRIKTPIQTDRIAYIASEPLSRDVLKTGNILVVAHRINADDHCEGSGDPCSRQPESQSHASGSLEAKLAVVDETLCNEIRKHKQELANMEKGLSANAKAPIEVGPNRFCLWASRQDACEGDSGGGVTSIAGDPLTYEGRNLIVGLVSSGPTCEQEARQTVVTEISVPTKDDPAPGLYTVVASYTDWIQNVIGVEQLKIIDVTP